MGKFGLKKSKLFVLSRNWHTWYLGRADFESGVRFSKFRPQNPFLGEFGAKKLFISIFSPNVRKYGPEKTPCLDSFHTVAVTYYVHR